MANIRKRGNKYQIRVSVGIDGKGKQITESITYKPSESTPKKIEKEVKAFALEFEQKIKEGKYLQGNKITFSEFLPRWKDDYAKANLSVNVLEEYERILNQRFIKVIGNLKLSKINALHLQSIYSDMRKEGKAPATIKRAHAVVSSVFSHAYKWGIIEENICKRVELPKQEKANDQIKCFNVEQASDFLNALTLTYTNSYKAHKSVSNRGLEHNVSEYTQEKTIPLQFQVFYNMALYGGFRRGELIALTWNDIDFSKNSISITKSSSKTKEGQITKAPKTSSGNRTITLPNVCMKLLKEWKTEQKKYIVKMGSAWKGYKGVKFNQNYIFIQETGKQMHLDTPSHKFKEIIMMYNKTIDKPEKKLPMIRLHDLRHTSATLLIAQNVDIRTVANRLGHSKTSVTLDIYSHALKQLDKQASDTLSNLLCKNA